MLLKVKKLPKGLPSLKEFQDGASTGWLPYISLMALLEDQNAPVSAVVKSYWEGENKTIYCSLTYMA